MIINEKAVELDVDNTKWKIYSGIFCMLGGPLVLLVQSTYGELAMVFVILGLFIVYLGKNDRRRIDRFYMFKEFIGDKDEVCIEDLAKRVLSDKHTVVQDLMWMMERGYFEDVEIDASHEFFGKKKPFRWSGNTFSSSTRVIIQPSVNTVNIQSSNSYKEKEEVLYCSEVCDCCGGITKIKVGGGGVCDYCRAPIGKYKK